ENGQFAIHGHAVPDYYMNCHHHDSVKVYIHDWVHIVNIRKACIIKIDNEKLPHSPLVLHGTIRDKKFDSQSTLKIDMPVFILNDTKFREQATKLQYVINTIKPLQNLTIS